MECDPGRRQRQRLASNAILRLLWLPVVCWLSKLADCQEVHFSLSPGLFMNHPGVCGGDFGQRARDMGTAGKRAEEHVCARGGKQSSDVHHTFDCLNTEDTLRICGDTGRTLRHDTGYSNITRIAFTTSLQSDLESHGCMSQESTIC